MLDFQRRVDEGEGMKNVGNHVNLVHQDEPVHDQDQIPRVQEGAEGLREGWRCHGLLQRIQDSPHTHRKADKAE